MVKVSIIVPIYNTEKYLKKCIDSLISQSLKDIEIILINDGSLDNSDKIIKGYKDKRIKYIKKDNEGIGKTRNLGIRKASGQFIMFIDSDDYIDKDCALKMYEKAIKSNCDLVMSNYFRDRNGTIEEVYFSSFKDSSVFDNPSIFMNINLGPCNKIYKRELLLDNKIFFEEKLKYEDVPFVIKTLLNAKKIGKIDDCLSYYVIHANSETTIRDKRLFDIIDEVSIIEKEFSKYPKLRSVFVDLAAFILTDYSLQCKFVEDPVVAKSFIKAAYAKLDSIDENWRNCNFIKNLSLDVRIIKRNPFLVRLYCNYYRKKNNL